MMWQHTLLVLVFSIVELAQAQYLPPSYNSTGCHADHCARAVTGTRLGSFHLAEATSDCLSFLGTTTITPAPATQTTTYTQNITVTAEKLDRRFFRGVLASSSHAIPTYASACTDDAQYSSACSCLGVTAGPSSTLDGTTTTTTTTTNATVTYTAPPAPSCTADISCDPLNCGACGIVCDSGICSNGACVSTSCPSNNNCDEGFNACGDLDTGDCFCFSDDSGAGFCGQNAVCAEVDACAYDEDCDEESICAWDTCCPALSDDQPGVCLVGWCVNPGDKLRRAATKRVEIVDLARLKVDTAAWPGR